MRSSPKLITKVHESPLYQTLGVGLTDRLFLLGHSDHLKLNDPYPVASVRDAVDDLGADTDSPLLLAMLEAYFSGARDIWLVASAPMDEYEEDLEERDEVYYQTYKERLNDTYDLLKKWDIAQLVVPVDAPFNSTVDFLGPLVNFCAEASTFTGGIHLGIMGTRGIINPTTVHAMANDGRLDSLGAAGKYVSVFAGDGTFHLKELPFNHTSSVAVAVAAEMTQLPLNRGLTYKKLRNVITTVGQDMDPEDIEKLAQAGINPVGRNLQGRRGQSFQVVPFTDNTLSKDGSDFWSLTQMRLVSRVSNEIHGIGRRSIGTIGYDLFRGDVEDYLIYLVTEDVIRGYDLNIRRAEWDPSKALVDVDLRPFFGVRELNVSVLVGPSKG